jgi:2-polyprenyl-3-methyl-5-hydroxy-6-metoxy-1,4-benzoquinol methylase
MKKEEIYAIGYPAKEAYFPFIKFVMRYASKKDKILDIGGGEGAYSAELKRRGFNVVCIDINENYIRESQNRGVHSCVMDATSLGFCAKSFDIVLLFEVLEHIEGVDSVLEEVKRVARKNVLITVPNCSGFSKLKRLRLTYDHFLATDHINFFTKKDLEDLLSKHFKKIKVEEAAPIRMGVGLPWRLLYPILGLYKLKVIKGDTYYRLYAVTEVK